MLAHLKIVDIADIVDIVDFVDNIDIVDIVHIVDIVNIDIFVLIWNTNLDGFRGYVQSQKCYPLTYLLTLCGLRDASASKNFRKKSRIYWNK